MDEEERKKEAFFSRYPDKFNLFLCDLSQWPQSGAIDSYDMSSLKCDASCHNALALTPDKIKIDPAGFLSARSVASVDARRQGSTSINTITTICNNNNNNNNDSV